MEITCKERYSRANIRSPKSLRRNLYHIRSTNIVDSTSQNDLVSNISSHFSSKITKGIFSTKNQQGRRSKSRLSGQVAFGMAAIMLLSVGFSFSLSSNADQSSVNNEQVASIHTNKAQLANIANMKVESRIKKLPLNSRLSKNRKTR